MKNKHYKPTKSLKPLIKSTKIRIITILHCLIGVIWRQTSELHQQLTSKNQALTMSLPIDDDL